MVVLLAVICSLSFNETILLLRMLLSSRSPPIRDSRPNDGVSLAVRPLINALSSGRLFSNFASFELDELANSLAVNPFRDSLATDLTASLVAAGRSLGSLGRRERSKRYCW